MVRRARQYAPVSLAALAAMFAFGAVAEEPQAPLPFELFHGTDTFSNALSDGAAPEGHAGSEPDAHSGMADGEHADTAPGHGGADAASSQQIEGIRAPYSEPGETAGFEMDDQMEDLEPYKLVRSLQFVQDAVVQGDDSAMEMQRFLIGVIDSRLRQADQSVFDDPRNVDAALIYAMSGGNPATLDILAIKDKFGNFDNEVTTVLRAYLNGRAAKTQCHCHRQARHRAQRGREGGCAIGLRDERAVTTQ